MADFNQDNVSYPMSRYEPGATPRQSKKAKQTRRDDVVMFYRQFYWAVHNYYDRSSVSHSQLTSVVEGASLNSPRISYVRKYFLHYRRQVYNALFLSFPLNAACLHMPFLELQFIDEMILSCAACSPVSETNE